MANKSIHDIVDHVVFLQSCAEERFGSFHYGDDFVVRDFVAERIDKHADHAPGAVISEKFRGQYEFLSDKNREEILANVKLNFVKDELGKYVKSRGFPFLEVLSA